MKQKTSKIIITLIIFTLLLNFSNQIFIIQALPTIQTNKPTYKAGESLTVFGTATPNTLISVQLFDPNGRRVAVAQAEADREGAWETANIYTFNQADPSGTWIIKAYQDGWAEIKIQVDVTPPILNLALEPEKTTFKAETITLTLTSNEKLSKVTITVTQPNMEPQPIPVTSINQTKWIGTYTIKTQHEGESTIQVYVEDLAGNPAKMEKKIMVDTTPPKVTITGIPAKTEDATITIRGTVSEPLPQVKLLIPGLPPLTIPVDKEKLTWGTEITLTTTGHNIIKAIVQDEAGNLGEDSKVVFYVGPLEIIKTEMGAIRESINMISNLVMVAVILSIVAAVFSIVAVVTIVRRIVLK